MASGSSLKDISSFDALIKFLEKVHLVVSEYVPDDHGNAKNIFLQDQSMKDMFNFFPERVCIDCTYKQFDIGLYMYIFICEDSNGKNIIIAVGFLQINDIHSLTWLFKTFRQHNPNWRRIKSIAVDFQIKQREFIREFFPQALQIICFFHAYVCFKSDSKEFCSLSYVTEEQMLFANDAFRNLYFAPNQAEFEFHYAFYSNLPSVLVSYLDNVWMPYQQEWRICLDYAHEDVFHNINFFLQDVCDAVAAISNVSLNHIEFIKDIFLYIALRKKDKLSFFQKVDTCLYSQFSAEYQITKAFTPYAAKFVIQQLDLSKDITCTVNGNNDTYIFNYLGFSISATINQCSCHFFLFTLLPCRHIFVVRRLNHYCMFDDSIVLDDWNLEYYEQSVVCMDSHLEKGTNSQIPKDSASRTVLARQIFGTSLLSILELPRETFKLRMEELKTILNAWKNDNDVSLQFAGIDRPPCQLPTYNALFPNEFQHASKTGHHEDSSIIKLFNNPTMSSRLNYNGSSSLNNMMLYEPNTAEPSVSTMVNDILSSSCTIDANDIPSTSIDISSGNMASTSSGLNADDIISTLKSLISTDVPSTSSPFFNIYPTNSEKIAPFEANRSKKMTVKKVSSDPEINIDIAAKTLNHNQNFLVLQSSSVQAIDNFHSLQGINSKAANIPFCDKMNSSTSFEASNQFALRSIPPLNDFNSRILSSPVINLAYIIYVICQTKDECLAWLRRNNLIPTLLRCTTCGCAMVSRSFPHTQDGSSWCCTKTGGKRCSKRQSVRVGTWLGIVNMPIENLLVFCYLWINRFDKNIIIQVTSVSTSNFMKLDKFFTRVSLHSVKSTFSLKECSYKAARDIWIEQNGGAHSDIFLPFLKANDMIWKHEFLGGLVKTEV